MFQQTIKTINREHYSTEQLDIWSGQAGWINRLEQDVTFVATIQTYIVGFITIKDDGLIDLLKEVTFNSSDRFKLSSLQLLLKRNVQTIADQEWNVNLLLVSQLSAAFVPVLLRLPSWEQEVMHLVLGLLIFC
ncbi:hypothetical protein FED53_09645 [Priestia flexa]|uniref:hypothetical protein n=1 Tax=Priestia flexa TaxID=86664 RepID=UPI0010FC048C|nr:hypothetical protein FED53_09645 [Priestia flexa]